MIYVNRSWRLCLAKLCFSLTGLQHGVPRTNLSRSRSFYNVLNGSTAGATGSSALVAPDFDELTVVCALGTRERTRTPAYRQSHRRPDWDGNCVEFEPENRLASTTWGEVSRRVAMSRCAWSYNVAGT